MTKIEVLNRDRNYKRMEENIRIKVQCLKENTSLIGEQQNEDREKLPT